MKAIYTDEWFAYKDIVTEGTKHKAVRYRGGEYAKGDVHRRIPNESFFRRRFASLAGLPCNLARLYTSV